MYGQRAEFSGWFCDFGSFLPGPFGMIITLLSGVVSIVFSIWISLTTPVLPPSSMKSPTLNGLKIIIRMPPAKLARLPCSANPTAKEAAPRIATKEAASTPTIPRTTTIRRTLSAMEINELRNLARVSSIPLFLSIFRMPLPLVINP